MRRRIIAAVCVLAGVLGTTTAATAGGSMPRPKEVKVALPAGNSNPSIANGVATGSEVALYTSSGLGPLEGNPSAPPGSPERCTDLSLFPGGTWPAGVTVTEAQALSVLSRIRDNLAAAGLTPANVITMKAYLTRPAGASAADYAGWNRAYRQFFANVDLKTGATIPVPMGTNAPAPPILANKARPARATMEVAGLAVPCWLVEVEVVAAYQR
ncbi:Rid family hydrolase [Actinopolymorpha alba]|uniref:Rid family hydrolase n=1 Tax=Actinopolymorpha alba TaxID=533267 RepID=UPI00036558C6|nr:Rid family hydrolase [Actinopolymorpha alba]